MNTSQHISGLRVSSLHLIAIMFLKFYLFPVHDIKVVWWTFNSYTYINNNKKALDTIQDLYSTSIFLNIFRMFWNRRVTMWLIFCNLQWNVRVDSVVVHFYAPEKNSAYIVMNIIARPSVCPCFCMQVSVQSVSFEPLIEN
jgi:hypothetical protein